MGYKLICGQNPKTLGIEDADGNWDMEKFKEHVETCQECSKFSQALTKTLSKGLGGNKKRG